MVNPESINHQTTQSASPGSAGGEKDPCPSGGRADAPAPDPALQEVLQVNLDLEELLRFYR